MATKARRLPDQTREAHQGCRESAPRPLLGRPPLPPRGRPRAPGLGADPKGNNDFRYGDGLRGFRGPAGAHARRANPRDALDDEGSVNVRLHRMIRRGTSYGPMLHALVNEDR